MNLTISQEGASPFDQIRQVDEFGTEYWLARQLQPLLGYTQWRRFEETIERAKQALKNSGYSIEDHFADAGNVVERPQGGGSRQSDYKLSRFSCYLVTMNGDQSTPPPVETVIDNHTATPFVDELTKNPLTNDLTRRSDASPVPNNEREEENIKLHEVRDVVGKLTPNLKKLIADFTLDDVRSALTLYRARQQSQQIRDSYGWLKKCLQQKWWQDNQTHTGVSTDARKDTPIPLTASEKLTDEQKVWYERAIALGICLPAAIEELPIRMGLVCARVIIPNRRPHDPPFDILPIEKLMVQYQL